MPVAQRPRPRVLVGNLDPVVRLGMVAVLEEQGVEVVGAAERPQALVLLAGRLQPDAVVLDLGEGTSRELADRVRLASPDTRVILWARDEDAMEVLDPGAAAPRRSFVVGADGLRCELTGSETNRVKE